MQGIQQMVGAAADDLGMVVNDIHEFGPIIATKFRIFGRATNMHLNDKNIRFLMRSATLKHLTTHSCTYVSHLQVSRYSYLSGSLGGQTGVGCLEQVSNMVPNMGCIGLVDPLQCEGPKIWMRK